MWFKDTKGPSEHSQKLGGKGKDGDVVRFELNFKEKFAKVCLNGKEIISKKQWNDLPKAIIPMLQFPGAKGETISIRYVSSM